MTRPWCLNTPFPTPIRYASLKEKNTIVASPSSIKLASLDIDPVLLHRHTQILHGQDRPRLPAPALTTAAVPTPLHAQLCRLLRFPGPASSCRARSRARKCTRSSARAHRRRIAQRVVTRCGIRRANPAVLVRIRGDVGDEFLRGQRQQSCQGERSGIRAGARGVCR